MANVDNSLSPHGGSLVQRVQPLRSAADVAGLPAIEVREQIAHECVNIAYGFFSPLTGFMGSADVASVADSMRLANGYVWPIPIVLDVSDAELGHSGVSVGSTVLLTHQGNPLATLEVSEIFAVDLTELAGQDLRHHRPGAPRRPAHPELCRPFRRRRHHPGLRARHQPRPSTATGARRRNSGRSWTHWVGSGPLPTRRATFPTPATSI